MRRLIVVLMALVLGACTLSSGDSSTSSSQGDPLVDGDFVRTPFGRRHASCVHDVGDDSAVDSNGSVRHANGATSQIDCSATMVLPSVGSSPGKK